MRRPRLIVFLSLFLSGALGLSVFFPWFTLPILGWEVPAPAWNWAGFSIVCLSLVTVFRSIGGSSFRWLVRFCLVPAFYFWWTSVTRVKAWGADYLGSAQLKLMSVNQGLSQLGMEPIAIYDGPRWRVLEPQYGWYLAGGCLLVSLLTTLADQPLRLSCKNCQLRSKEEDQFCHGCGHGLLLAPVCENCGNKLVEADKYCRLCGREQCSS